MQYEAHMPDLRTHQPLVGRLGERPEAGVAQWVGSSVCVAAVVARKWSLGLALEVVSVTPRPELGSAEAAGSQEQEHA